MKGTEERLHFFSESVKDKNICVMILGLGSVGSYLLDYLISMDDPAVKIVVAGRSFEKMEEKVNITRIGALIRGVNRSHILIERGVDFNNISDI